MRSFKADLHIHTLLSPCGSLEMSPENIVQTALNKSLDIIAITDHNSTKQALLVQKIGANKGLFVICGAEINSAEEVHCLALFENIEKLKLFQQFIDQNIIPIKNKPELFGEQVVVDEHEMIIEEVEYLLINALKASLNEIEKKVHQLDGLFIPAHIDRPFNGLFSQLGFIPKGLQIDAFEISANAKTEHWSTNEKIPTGSAIIRNSDAHLPEQIGKNHTFFHLNELTFNEIKLALHGKGGRIVEIK